MIALRRSLLSCGALLGLIALGLPVAPSDRAPTAAPASAVGVRVEGVQGEPRAGSGSPPGAGPVGRSSSSSSSSFGHASSGPRALAPDLALELRRLELLSRVERALSTQAVPVWGRGPHEGLLGLAPVECERWSAGSPREAALQFLGALGLGLGGWGVQEAGSPLPPGPTLVLSRVTALGERAALAAVEPHAHGVPLLDGGWTLELRRDAARGWEPRQALGRLHAAPRGVIAWHAEGERAVRARWGETPARRVIAWTGGWEAAWVVRGLREGEAREEVLSGLTGAPVQVRSLGCAGTAMARVAPDDASVDPRVEDRPLPGLRVFQGLSVAVSDAAGAHPFTGVVSVPALEGPGLRVFRTRWEPIGFAGRRVWDEAGELAWSGPADFTFLDGQLDPAQGDAVHAFWHLGSYRTWLGRAFPLTRAWSRRPGEPPALERRIAVWPDVPGPLGYFQDLPHICDGEEFAGLIQLGVVGPSELGRDERLSLARVGDLVRHEYTHALLAGLADVYGTGVDEGLADYFPCAEAEDPRWCQGLGPRFFRDLSGASGRLVYPRDAEPQFEPHRVGNILGQALWEARSAAGDRAARARLDLAVMAAVVRCPPRPDLLQFRAALVAADRDVNDGRFVPMLEGACFAHGIGPAPGAAPTQPPRRALRITHAASYADAVSPGGWASAFGLDLALRSESASAPFPGELAGTRLTITDALGQLHVGALAAVGPTQVNFLVPPGAAAGPAMVRVENAFGAGAEGAALIVAVAPGLFSADGTGRGLPAGTWMRVAPDGARTEGPLAGPLERGPPGSRLFLVLYGTGLAGAREVEARVGGLPAQVLFAGPQGLPGLDQVNLLLPDLTPGLTELVVRCDGRAAGPLQVELR